ncbi:MAG TPA: hypothetical protein EYO34_09810 [Candidatus Marinimicrobia bacterium]|nr:hypothetical protein [Candidatus Neomarinimicrobiota bacterium]
MNIIEANKIFRKSIIKSFFEEELVKLDFKKSNIKHTTISGDGLMQSNLLHIFFDIETGADYPDGDEWFIADFLFPYSMNIPDEIKGADYFTTISVEEGKNFWHHREMVRYKYGKTKKLTEALEFLDAKYKELHSMVEPLEKDIK